MELQHRTLKLRYDHVLVVPFVTDKCAGKALLALVLLTGGILLPLESGLVARL